MEKRCHFEGSEESLLDKYILEAPSTSSG